MSQSTADTLETTGGLLHTSPVSPVLRTTAMKRATVYESISRGRMQSNLHKHSSSCVTRIDGKPIFGIPPSVSRSTLLSPESRSQQSFNSWRTGLHTDRLFSCCKLMLKKNVTMNYVIMNELLCLLPRKVNLL